MTFTTPSGTRYKHLQDMLKQPHLLIAGTTGAGKSTLINALMYTALFQSPLDVRFVLIDPKGNELIDYAELPHTERHCYTFEAIEQTVADCVSLMDKRYKIMRAKREKIYTGTDFYIVIDEYNFIKFRCSKQTETNIKTLAMQGRAAKIHLIIATQRPTSDVIDGCIKSCLPSRVCLRTATRQESKNVLDCFGAEALPPYGSAFYQTPETLMKPTLCSVPYYSQNQINEQINHWLTQMRKKPAIKRAFIFVRLYSLQKHRLKTFLCFANVISL